MQQILAPSLVAVVDWVLFAAAAVMLAGMSLEVLAGVGGSRSPSRR
jgi:hypothetical protein